MNKKYNFLLLILIFLISFVTFYRLLRPGYFSMMDDMHVFRLQQLDQCLKDGQIPCRFIRDGGMGYGYPLFNYYSPFVYYLSEFFHIIGFSLINSIKISFALTHIIGAFGMYFFAALLWGNIGGFISSIVFLLAPYQATDSFVRGSLAELMAINFLPWIFYFLTNFIKQEKHRFLLIISLSLLLVTHNLISVAVAPILLSYSLFLLIKDKKFNIKMLLKLLFIVLISASISASFLLPALFEKNLVTVDTMTQGYFYYVNHFATLHQLFISRFWGFGASLWGPVDDMAFQIGIIQWTIPILALVLLIFKKSKKYLTVSILFALTFLFSIFLTHNKSTFVWKLLPFMAYFQFPWRFLSIAIFASSFLAGGIILTLSNKYKNIFAVIIVVFSIILNFTYFKEDIWFNSLTDQEKLSSEEIVKQSGAGLKDYWPKYSTSFPTSFAPEKPVLPSGSIINNYTSLSNKLSLDLTLKSDAKITLPKVYFPESMLYIDNKVSDYEINKQTGLIEFNLSSGTHSILLVFKDTPLRKYANMLSIIGIVLAIITSIRFKHKNEK
jgi:uncharacterized membrane protein